MTACLAVEAPVHLAARKHLEQRAEQVGFYLARYDDHARLFSMFDWRAMPPASFEVHTGSNLELRDHVRPELLTWADDADAALVEAHSHSPDGGACFSVTDLIALEEWVPHIRWRSHGRPYAAIVTSGDSFDALAWADTTGRPDQIDRLTVGDVELRATGLTLARFRANAGASWE